MALGHGSLKCVISSSSREAIEEVLRNHVENGDVLPVCDGALLVYTDAEPTTIRDWLLPYVEDSDLALVIEFERWSGRGDAIDRDWLTRRGH